MNTGYLRHLAHFVLAVETGSVTAAANRLGLSPSAVSESIKTLESYFGEPLLERTRKGVRPVSLGISVFEEARGIVTALETSLAQKSEDGLSGELRLSVPTEVASNWFTGAVKELADQAPDLTCWVYCEDAPADYEKFTRDLFVRVSDKPDYPGLHVLHHHTTRAALVLSPDLLAGKPVNEALSQVTLVGGVSDKDAMLRLNDGQEFALRNRVAVSSIQTRLDYARSGMGLAKCLYLSVVNDLRDGGLVEIFPGNFGPSRVHILIGTPHARPPMRVRHVAQKLSEAVAERSA